MNKFKKTAAVAVTLAVLASTPAMATNGTKQPPQDSVETTSILPAWLLAWFN